MENKKSLSFEEQDLQLEKLWIELADIPFDEYLDGELVISKDWHIFEKGDSREYIWSYFDDWHSMGINYLLNEFEY